MSKSWARNFARSLDSASPTIMAGMAAIGVVSTVVLAVRAGQQAKKILDSDKAWSESVDQVDEAGEENKSETSTTQSRINQVRHDVRLTWKIFVPTAVSGACTIALIVGSNRASVHKQIALAGAYSLLDSAFRNYKDEVLEQFGEAKERKVRDELLRKEMERKPLVDREVILVGGGEQLFFESLTGRYFKSDVEDIRKAENDFNRQITLNIMYASLNEWFDLLGLEQTGLGEILGFNVDRPVDTFFTAVTGKDGKPCLAIGYKHHPFREFGQY